MVYRPSQHILGLILEVLRIAKGWPSISRCECGIMISSLCHLHGLPKGEMQCPPLSRDDEYVW